MSYLHKEQRRETILQAAMRVALAEGFAGMTVRNIAGEAQVAAGQVHHHFASSGELKSQAFIRLIRVLFDAQKRVESASWRRRLHAMLGSDDGGFEPYIRLWREAQILADKDADLKNAYLLTMRMWHEETVAIINGGCAAGEFVRHREAAEIAWRLIALVCGLDGMYALGMAEISEAAFEQHLTQQIELELCARR
ncbi:TetR family transcriptional regulator [Intestinirhabdus alba]|jgi:AcrR family transcriptional regulator|uniref:TetR family transcriptional regulator n=1 Tax=Intestinirhabdus alba TaxID=2899544 RepID=A0A6L6IMR9_9ENTR|nr:TetR family transcriptional regulator [Intestinirhabdus alba]MTH46023.1 TetR family transcriptional regulator [Intestinirhabdus alba]